MDNILKEINAVLGVVGSFVCLNDGSLVARALPEKYPDEQVGLAERIVSQTCNALETSGQRVTEADWLYDNGRLVLKNLRGGILVILCARSINRPLLNLTTNVAAKKLATELKPAKISAPAAKSTAPAPTVPSLAGRVVTPAPLLVELEQETRRLLEIAQSAHVTLCAIDPLGVWWSCPRTRALVAPPEKRSLDFAGLSGQNSALARCLEQAGYQGNQRFNAFHGDRRLHFTDAQRDLNVNIFIDAFEMYHRFDLTALLAQEETALAETALLLTRLQMVDVNDTTLGDICALLLEHDISIGSEKGKIDASQIMHLCADDWGWYKTSSTNLKRASAFTVAALPPVDRAVVGERIQRLLRGIEDAPKSLRWQTRARLGESVKWYETPLVPNAAVRPGMAIG